MFCLDVANKNIWFKPYSMPRFFYRMLHLAQTGSSFVIELHVYLIISILKSYFKIHQNQKIEVEFLNIFHRIFCRFNNVKKWKCVTVRHFSKIAVKGVILGLDCCHYQFDVSINQWHMFTLYYRYVPKNENFLKLWPFDNFL